MKEGAPSNEVCINFGVSVIVLYYFGTVDYVHDLLFSSELIIGCPWPKTCVITCTDFHACAQAVVCMKIAHATDTVNCAVALGNHESS